MQGKATSQKKWEKFFERLILNKGNISKTCEEMGISRTTYYVNREKKEGLMEKAKKSLQTTYVPVAEMVIMLALGRGDATTARWVLQCLSALWQPKATAKFIRKITHEVEQGIPEKSKIWDKLAREYEKNQEILKKKDKMSENSASIKKKATNKNLRNLNNFGIFL